VTRIPELRAWLRPRLLELRIRFWAWRGARIVAREERVAARERHLRITRQFTAPIANASLTGGLIKPRKKWSLGR